MKSKFITIVFLFALVNSFVAHSKDVHLDPINLINEMSDASINLNYDGVFMYRHGSKLDTMRIIHKNDDGYISERLISLSGNAREVVRKNNEIKYFFPDKKVVLVEKNQLTQLVPSHIPEEIEKISNFYTFEIAGDNRIAGLDTWIVNINPMDKYRYGYQLWIDKESKLLLRSILRNYRGVILEDVMFLQMKTMPEIKDNILKTSILSADFKWIYNDKDNAARQTKLKKKWTTSWMPMGFLMSKFSKHPLLSSAIPVEHYIYTDGLATISIFVEKINNENKRKVLPKTSSFGGINTYTKQTDGYQITAVGEVPKTTVKLIVNSVKAKP